MGWVVHPPTLRQDAADSKFIVYARPVTDPKDGDQRDATFLVIRDVLKDDPAITRRQMLRIPRRIEIKDAKNPPSFLVFGDVFKNQIDVFRGVEGGPALVEYVRGLVAVAPKGDVEVLRFCFDHLASTEKEVADDAFAEFNRAASADMVRVAPRLNPVKLRRWLTDEKAPAQKLSLYAFLLGHCGERRDAVLLRTVLDRQIEKGQDAGLDFFYAGYTLLDPAAGWAAVHKLAGDGSRAFRIRFAALRTVRFFHTVRPGVVASRDLFAVVALFLDQEDIADIAVEDLRRWRYWDLTDRVLALSERKFTSEGTAQIVRRVVLRYAIQCPDKRCKACVATEREKDPEGVKDQERLLHLEDVPDPKLN